VEAKDVCSLRDVDLFWSRNVTRGLYLHFSAFLNFHAGLGELRQDGFEQISTVKLRTSIQPVGGLWLCFWKSPLSAVLLRFSIYT
jgi:hypothetical protein